jgi:ABC-type transport system involved in cytochrome c biogenesis permease component
VSVPVTGPAALLTLLKKDLRLQWRERAQGVAILAFGGAALLLL